ncbi:hypothetical protein HPP92_007905 [Vanilla planifolia]|uniref:Protein DETOXIFICATION n=1 Tax=Vanilla planifolia TaxID=51239 RepID=A0A835RDG9_VANPL|nr:hypothetical protein HPP92_007905 [Vanilla planifolia]
MGSLNDFLVSDSVAASRTQRMEWPLRVFFNDARSAFRKDDLGLEIAQIALPAALALLADPIASLISKEVVSTNSNDECPVELAAVGVSIAVFNQVSRVAIFPLVSITTSFVAEEDASSKIDDELIIGGVKHHSELNELVLHDALVIGGILGILQAIFLVFTARPILNFMGVKNDSPMLTPARQYLTLRSLGAPAVLLSLAMQVVGDAANIILDPVFIFVFNFGVSGAAIAHVISQYILALILLWRLLRKVEVLPPSITDLQFSKFLKNGSLLLARVIAVTFCITLSASMAARLGSIPMAAFQICLQVWLTSSLLADGLAVAGQTILASAFAQRGFSEGSLCCITCLTVGIYLRTIPMCSARSSLQFVSRLFTNDAGVLHVINIGIPFVVLTQPINALAFVFDGVNFGASDFAYSAYSLVMVAIVSILCLVFLSSNYGFIGIWVALTIYMTLRMFVGFWRIGTARGPWSFLRRSSSSMALPRTLDEE